MVGAKLNFSRIECERGFDLKSRKSSGTKNNMERRQNPGEGNGLPRALAKNNVGLR